MKNSIPVPTLTWEDIGLYQPLKTHCQANPLHTHRPQLYHTYAKLTHRFSTTQNHHFLSTLLQHFMKTPHHGWKGGENFEDKRHYAAAKLHWSAFCSSKKCTIADLSNRSSTLREARTHSILVSKLSLRTMVKPTMQLWPAKKTFIFAKVIIFF